MSEKEITRSIAQYSETDKPSHCWTMTIDGEIVSQLWADIETGEIMQVETPREHQCNGHASALYHQAASEITIYHAPESHRTYEGNRFAQSVGGESLPCRYGCCTNDEE